MKKQKKIRVSALLELDTIEYLIKEAKEKSISVSAVIRQKVEASYNLKEMLKKVINRTDPEFGTGNN